jgi:NADH-quinone oxidoreductase subunit L
MENFIQYLVLIPLIGFIVNLLMPKKDERLLAWSGYLFIGAHFFIVLGFVILWFANGRQVINLKEITVYKTINYEFYIDFYFDKVSAVFLLIGASLTFMITVYSRFYLHREEGFQRFFNTISFFYLGYVIIVVAGNLETLFIGWEILGISSFLLIAYYRNRYLPVKNAVKVFSIYRIGDVGLILAMWLSHHMWHENITFYQLNDAKVVDAQLLHHSFVGAFIALMIFLSAAIKSAMLPFSSWLPRAMEGPTVSSAIFYGSLSVHMGAFIMLRTFHFWEHQTSIRIFIGVMGLMTAITANFIARVQSSIKSQVAYSSISQIGIIFIEISLGLELIALVHIAGNAFLRSYQLLISPSVVAYKMREQFYNFKAKDKTIEDTWPKRIEYGLYVLSLKEWNLDGLMYRFLWSPTKSFGKNLNFITFKSIFYLIIPSFVIGCFGMYHVELIPQNVKNYLPTLLAFIGLSLVLKSFTERKSVRKSWLLIILSHCWIALAVSFNERFEFAHVALYLSGCLLSGFIGIYALMVLFRKGEKFDLSQFYGHAFAYPRIALIFLIACLGLAGFPITPTFVGLDIIFSHIGEDQFFLACFVALSFIITGLSLIRIYARIFLGPHQNQSHEIAHRSS